MLRRLLRSRRVVVVLGLGLLVAVVGSVNPRRGRTEGRAREAAESGAASTLGARLGPLEIAVADLTRRVQELESRRPAPREPVNPSAVVGQGGATRVDLAERVSRLEQQAMRREPQVARPKIDQAFMDPQQRAAARIESAHTAIREKNLSDADRAQAWFDLAQLDVYPWTDDVIATMVDIGLSSEDNRAREVVWIGAESQFRSPLLVQPLIAALGDPVEDVREEAADALSQYLDMPGVQKALVWTSNYDESEEVRNEASRALRQEE